MYHIQHTSLPRVPLIPTLIATLEGAERCLEGLARSVPEFCAGIIGYGDRSITVTQNGHVVFMAEIVGAGDAY